jgi:hypothetical protein
LITWNCEWFFLFFVFLVIVWFFLTGNGDTMKKIRGVESNFDWVVRVLLEICVELWGFREVWWIMWKSWLNQLDWTCDDYFEMRYGREILSLRVFKYLISWLCDFNFFGVLSQSDRDSCNDTACYGILAFYGEQNTRVLWV